MEKYAILPLGQVVKKILEARTMSDKFALTY